MADPIALQLAKQAKNKNAPPAAPGPMGSSQKVDSLQNTQINNTGKVQFNDPYSAPWVKYGFPDTPEGQAAYDAIYNAPPAVQAPVQAAPVGINNSDPFGSYLANNPDRQDAWTYLQQVLSDYGLSDLTSFVKDQVVQGRSQDEVVQRLREQPTYKKRFAAIEQRKSQGLPAISEADVISFEKTATGLMQAAGLPKGFYDSTDDFTNFLVKDISPSELSSRINDGYLAVMNAPKEVRDQLGNLYGVTDGDLAAYYLDPDRTQNLLQQRQAAAQASASGVRSGFGALNLSEAERLAALGVSGQQADQGFASLQQQKELFNSLPGQNEDQVTRDQQLAAGFGNDAEQQQRLKRIAEQRTAQFGGSSQFSGNNNGFSGVGTAR
jgi:hypothetical protein